MRMQCETEHRKEFGREKEKVGKKEEKDDV